MWHNQALILLGHVCILRKKFWPGAELYSAPPALRWSPYMHHTHAHKHFAMYIAPYALHCNGGPVRKQLLFIFIEISCFLRLLYFWVWEVYSSRQIECLYAHLCHLQIRSVGILLTHFIAMFLLGTDKRCLQITIVAEAVVHFKAKEHVTCVWQATAAVARCENSEEVKQNVQMLIPLQKKNGYVDPIRAVQHASIRKEKSPCSSWEH